MSRTRQSTTLNEDVQKGFQTAIQEAADSIAIELTQEQCKKMVQYLVLLQKWNKTYNLTSIRDPEEMLILHIFDSLSVAPFVQAGESDNLLDVGTGPGLPGIPLAIVFPNLDIHLLDSNIKKTRFLTQCKIELGLTNVEVIHSRVEQVAENLIPETKFSQIISRAFATLKNMTDGCQQLLADDGVYLAMKGQRPEEEMQALGSDLYIKKVQRLHVPSCEAERHLIIIGNAES